MPDDSAPARSRVPRRALLALVGVIGLVLVVVVGFGPSAEDRTSPDAPTETEYAQAPTVTPTEGEVTGSSQVTGMPDDWDGSRVTEGEGGDEAMRLLDEAVAVIGPERSSIYNAGDALEVRVVQPTAEDEAMVANLQARTAIPLRVKAIPMSYAWLEETMVRLDADLPAATALVATDLEAARLVVALNLDAAAEMDPEVFAQQVHDLVATYLPDGIQRGLVLEETTPEQAVEITVGRRS